jgi:excisionase family DNA binding protein
MIARNWRPRHINVDRDFLVVEDVARLLRCSVDTARRIPRSDLPAYRAAGRHLLYLRSDVEDYVRRCGRPSQNADLLVREIAGEVLV